MQNDKILSATNVTKAYKSPAGVETPVLRSASLDIQRGEFLSIVGASGAGKSTMLHILGALDEPDSGELLFVGRDGNQVVISALRDKQLAQFRNSYVGFVFQFHHLMSEFTALENAAMPLLIAGVPRKKALEKAEYYLSIVGLEHRLHAKPNTLSGGESQRVAIARALVNEPEILLADEPTGNLDSDTSSVIMNLLLDLQKKHGLTLVIVTHSDDVSALSDRTVRLAKGQIL